jgi:hypothetical protein
VTPSKSSDPVLKRRSPTRPPPLSRDIDGFTVHRGFVLRGKKTTNRNRKTRATALLGRNHGERPVIVVYSCRWASPHNCKARFLGQRRRAVRGELATAFTDVVEPLPPPPGGCAAGDTQIVLVHHNSTGLATAVVHGSLSLQVASGHACCPHHVRRNARRVHLCLQGRGGHRCSLSCGH